MSYLRLAGVPLEKPGRGGGPSLKLVDVKLTTEWQVGTASPSFGSRELSYLPYPGRDGHRADEHGSRLRLDG